MKKTLQIKAGGSITVKKGSFSMHSIQAGLNIYLGEKNSNSNILETEFVLLFGIETLNEGMKAKNIEIYSGQIVIYSEKDAIVAEQIKINGGAIIISAGSENTKSSPFKKSEKLIIRGGYIDAGGTNCISGGNIDNNQPSISFYGETISKQTVIVTMEGKEVTKVEKEKEYNYLYFSCPVENSNKSFKITVDGKEVQSFNDNSCDDNSSEVDKKGDSNYQDNNQNSNNSNSSMITKFKYLVLIISLFLL